MIVNHFFFKVESMNYPEQTFINNIDKFVFQVEKCKLITKIKAATYHIIEARPEV